MTVAAGVGYSADADLRAAGRLAATRAWEHLGVAGGSPRVRPAPALGLLIGRAGSELGEAAEGAGESLGGLPLWGFSAVERLTPDGRRKRGAAAALLGGDLRVRAAWRGDFGSAGRDCVQKVLDELRPEPGDLLLAAADGVNGDGELLAQLLAETGVSFAGCLASGEAWTGRTDQLGGREFGPGGFSAAAISGRFAFGLGAAHCWQPVGASARVSGSDSVWVRSLDGRPAAETYARLFGAPGRAWTHPPLNELIRQYPLSFEFEGRRQIRSILRVEADGGFRMHAPVPAGAQVEILVGTPEACRAAAVEAASRALSGLNGARPRLALLMIDSAWAGLLELQPELEVQAIGEIIGRETPIIGGCTSGQLFQSGGGASPGLLNGHILAVIFGDPS